MFEYDWRKLLDMCIKLNKIVRDNKNVHGTYFVFVAVHHHNLVELLLWHSHRLPAAVLKWQVNLMKNKLCQYSKHESKPLLWNTSFFLSNNEKQAQQERIRIRYGKRQHHFWIWVLEANKTNNRIERIASRVKFQKECISMKG